MTGKYQPYSETIDSGVDWLGHIPTYWKLVPLKAIANVDNSGCYGADPEDSSHVYPVATTAQIDRNGQFGVDEMPIRSFTASEVVRYLCREGDILVVKSSGSATNIISGKAGIVTSKTPKFIFSNFLMRVSPLRSRVYPEFVYSLLTSHLTKERIKQMVSTTTYPNLQVGEYCSAKLPLPPLAEQRTIAAFLDYETTRIDQLIAKQQQLIELLKEKRQAVISHAVTKGLNPNAPMKDSGVEWLGQVPEHWDVWKLNHFCPIITCGVAATPEYVSEGVPFLSAQNIKNHKIDLSKGYKFVSQETHLVLTKYREPLKGDILLSRVGTIGEPCVVDVDFEFSIFVSLTHIRVHETICANRFLVYLLESQYAKALHTSVTLFGGGVGNLNVNDLREYKLPLPTRSKQLEICDYLDDRLAEFSALVDKAERAIELMQERRTALISAAVTGKIDLRGWQPPQREEAA